MTDWNQSVRPGITSIEPYSPGLTDDELKHQFGLSRVVKLNANENALGPSPLALQAVAAELQSLHHYPDGGSELLRQAIAAFHQVGKGHVLVGNGSDEIIKLISETFLEPGDQVIVPFPSFSQYGFGAAVMRANAIPVRLRADFTYDVEAIVSAVTERVKLVYICSPNNPTGTIIRQEELDWLLAHLPNHVVVILDMAYNDYSMRADRAVESAALFADPRVVVLHTFSKLYGLAGLRVGYALAHPDLLGYVHRVREPFNVNRLAQRAAVAALGDKHHREASRQLAADGRRFYEAVADRLGVSVVPAEGNFVLMETGDGADTMKRLMEQGVMVRAGFRGVESYVRITFGTPEENDLCAEALARVLSVSLR